MYNEGNLSDVFDNIAPQSKDDVLRRKERHRLRDAMYEQEHLMSQNYGNRNANQHMRDRKNTEPYLPERLYSNERNHDSRIGKGYMNPMHNRKQSDSLQNLSDLFPMQDGKMSRFSMLNDESRGDSRPNKRFAQPMINNTLNPMDRNMYSPRGVKSQVPYNEARSPHNDRLREDFYSGKAQQRMQQQTLPHNNRRNDGKKYFDDMLHNKYDHPEDDPGKRISTVTVGTEQTGMENFPSDIRQGVPQFVSKQVTPEHIKTPVEYKYTKRGAHQPMTEVRQMMPKKQFKEIDPVDMPRDLSNREIKRHMQRQQSRSRSNSASRFHHEPYQVQQPRMYPQQEFVSEKRHDPNSARRPKHKRGPSPLKKSFSNTQFEPQRSVEDTFGYNRRNTSRSDSKTGILYVEAIRAKSPEFYNNDSQNEPAVREFNQPTTLHVKSKRQPEPNHFSPMMAKDQTQYCTQNDSSIMNGSQVLRASWTVSKNQTTSFPNNNTFASSTVAKQPFYAKQNRHSVKGPAPMLSHSKSQTFARREPVDRNEMSSRNSVVRMSAVNMPSPQKSASFINQGKPIRPDQFEAYNPKAQQHSQKFQEEFQFVIENAENVGRPLYLMDVLEQLDFLDESILRVLNYEDSIEIYNQMKENVQAHKSDILIVSQRTDSYDITLDVQQNLYKILSGIQNLKPVQKGQYRLGQALLDQHTDPISDYNKNEERNIFQQVLAIRNLINRQAFTINDQQVQILHEKFKNISDHRLNRSPDGLERALSDRGGNPRGYQNTPPVQDPHIQVMNPGSFPQQVRKPQVKSHKPKTFDMRKHSSPVLPSMPQDPFKKAYLPKAQPSPIYKDPNQDPYHTDGLDNFGPDGEQRQLVCSIRVQIDGNHSEFLNVLEGDNPDVVVRYFTKKHNLTNSSTSELLRQVKEQYYL